MRLIDADALPIVTRGKNHRRKYVFADITDAPTIDAIPVEWMRTLQRKKGVGYSGWVAIDLIIQLWDREQKKQGAR